MDQSKHEKQPRRVGEDQDRNAGTRRNEEEIGKPIELEGERQGGQQHQGGHQQQGGQQHGGQQQGGQQRKPETERKPDQGQPTNR